MKIPYKYRRILYIALGVLLIAILAIIDDVTGKNVSFPLFYIIPIAGIAYLLGKKDAILMAVLSVVAWLVVDIRAQLDMPLYGHIWNILVRLCFFIFITYAISMLLSARQTQRELIEFAVHDLKSPLSGILMGINIVRTEYKDPSEKVERIMNIAESSAKRMLTFINSIVDYAKLESGKLELEKTDVMLRNIIQDAIGQEILIAEQKRIEIIVQNNEPELQLVTDYWLVVRILINLMSNAIKVSSMDSKIYIIAKKTESRVVISVKDEGPGIDKMWQKKIFNKFHQVHARQRGVQVGTGLGLSFCHQAVTHLGGKIYIESELGHGATISFELPLAK